MVEGTQQSSKNCDFLQEQLKMGFIAEAAWVFKVKCEQEREGE